MSDTADNLADTPDSGPVQTGPLSTTQAAGLFGALREREAADPAEEAEETVDDGQSNADPEPEAMDEPEAEGTTDSEPEPEEAEAPEDEPEGTPRDPKPNSYDIKLADGTTQKVTLEELTKGYLRQSDYSRKTSEIARERQKLEQERANLDEVVKKLGPLAPEEAEPDWDAIMAEDPIGAFQKFVQWNQKQKSLSQAREEAAKETHRRALQAQQEHAEYLQRQRETLLSLPEFKDWADDKKASSHQQKIRRIATEIYGFADTDLDNVTDHRVLRVLDDARRYREMMVKSKEVEKAATPAPKVRKPGAVQDKTTAAEEKLVQAKKSLAKTGSAEDAARALAALNRSR